MKTPASRQSVPTVAMALMVLCIIVAGFMALISIIIPGAVMMLAAIAALSGLFVAQYFVWGKWLYGYVVRQEQDRESREQQNPDRTTAADNDNVGI